MEDDHNFFRLSKCMTTLFLKKWKTIKNFKQFPPPPTNFGIVVGGLMFSVYFPTCVTCVSVHFNILYEVELNKVEVVVGL